MRSVFLAVLSPRIECNLLFPFRIIFPTCQSFKPLAPFQWKIDISARGLFWTKFNSEQLLFETFFDAMRIFGSVQPRSYRTILHTEPYPIMFNHVAFDLFYGYSIAKLSLYTK